VWKCFQDGQVFGDIYTIPFVLTTTELLGRIRNYRFKIYPKDSLIPAEVWKYDTESILEGMHNSIAHQQYEKNARIIVTENMDSLKFQNDGNFYEGDYKEYITGEKTPKSYRNPALIKAMVNIRMIDTQGYGIHKMYQSQKDRYLPMPDYDLSTADEVILNLPGTIIDENYSLMLLANRDMSLTDAVLLDQVQKGKPISDNAIKKLRKEGLIEGRKPHLYVSKQIAKATNTQVEYTLKKGFNDAECQEWIMKALNDHKVLSRKQINELLWNKLPIDYTDDQRVRKIGNLLTKLRKNDGKYDAKWDKIETEVEQIYQVWNTVSIDLYSLSIDNNAILTFNDGLNRATQAVKAKNKANAMNEITGIYGKILEYRKAYDKDTRKTDILTIQYNSVAAYLPSFFNIPF